MEIQTNGALNDSLQAYFSGVIEGYMTTDLIDQYYQNNIEHYCDNAIDYCDRLYQFIKTNLQFTLAQIEKHRHTDPYWRQVELSLLQVKGIDDGYRAVTSGSALEGPRLRPAVSRMLFLNLFAEFGTFEDVLGREDKLYAGKGHCSAIIKVLDDGNDLLVSHNTWSGYSSMTRVLKRYTLNYRDVSGKSIAMSSYPGAIFSMDDFYLISSGLTVLETTNNNYNTSLWQYVVADKVVFEFIRNTVANRLARTGREWTELFGKFNSGTYNNQFMVVDYNKFQKNVHPSKLPDDLLWIIEQLPGYVESADVTQVLRDQHYWPSYNVPFFPSIYQLSDQMSIYKYVGDIAKYDGTPRARIFKRDHNNVTDLSSLYHLMQYNDFKNDPLSGCNVCSPPFSAMFSIAARQDLDDPNGHFPPVLGLGHSADGAIDVKITSSELFSNLEMVAKSGPTSQQQPSFQWSVAKFSGVRHRGEPDLFQFTPVRVKWSPPRQILNQV